MRLEVLTSLVVGANDLSEFFKEIRTMFFQHSHVPVYGVDFGSYTAHDAKTVVVGHIGLTGQYLTLSGGQQPPVLVVSHS